MTSHAWGKLPGEREWSREGLLYFFAQCRSCGARIVTHQSAIDSGMAWIGWKGLFETCEETEAWDVMEG